MGHGAPECKQGREPGGASRSGPGVSRLAAAPSSPRDGTWPVPAPPVGPWLRRAGLPGPGPRCVAADLC
jgi:hypothetical protein